jgi:hypothetical protein
LLISIFSFGVFIPYIKEHFNAGSGEVSTIYSIQVGVTFAAGGCQNIAHFCGEKSCLNSFCKNCQPTACGWYILYTGEYFTFT